MEKRIQEIKNTETMKVIESYKNKKFSNKELKVALLDVQDKLLQMTFEKSHAENLSYTDLYNYFKSVATEYNLTGDEHYMRFEDELKTLKGNIGSLIAGEVGEKRVGNALRLLALDGAKILFNIEIEISENNHTEIDAIVIDKRGIHVLEIKNYKQNIEITPTGEIIENGNISHTYSLGVKFNEKEYAIKRVLQEAGYSGDVNYESILVLADNKVQVSDNYRFVKVCHVGNVVNILRKGVETKLSDTEIDEIFEIIDKSNMPKKYAFNELDFEQFSADYAYLMALIENKSADNAYENAECEAICDKKRLPNKTKRGLINCVASAIGGILVTSACFLIKAK